MEHILLVIHVIIAAALIGVVLIQRSDTDGFGLGSGSGGNFMTGRATANLLTRTTAILATLFIVNSLALGIIAAHGGPDSIVDSLAVEEQAEPTGPLSIEKNEGGAVAPKLNSEVGTSTKKATEKAVSKKAAKAPTVDADAPVVPTAD